MSILNKLFSKKSGSSVEPAVESLMTLLADPSEDIWMRAAISLGKIGKPAVDPLIVALRTAFEDEDKGRIWVGVTWALVSVGKPAVEPLIDTLKNDSDCRVRELAALVLGKIGDKRALGILTTALDDEYEQVSDAATVALERIHNAAAN